MDPSLTDPRNHVPEVTPADVWGDADGLQAGHGGAATVLPPKKPKTEGSSAAANTRNTEGLRIEAKSQRRKAEDADHQLHVQEIDGSVVRLDPEIPAAPRMPRQVSFHEKPAEIVVNPLQRGEGREWGRSRNQSFRWILGTGVGVATLVVVAMMLLPLVNESNAARPRPGQGGLVLAPEDHIEGIEALNDMLSRQAEAEQVFRTYAGAAIADDVLPLVWDVKAVEPLVRANHGPAIVPKGWVPPEDTRWSVFDTDGHPCGLLEGTLPDFTKFRAYLILSGKHLLLDWKASTAYGTATFAELEKNQGNPAEIRANIIPSGYYTAIFPEAEFQSYQLVSPDNNEAVWCYSRRGEPANEALARLFVGGEIMQSAPGPQKVTLRLEHGPAGALPNQWLVAEMLHKDWIIP